MDAGGQCPTCGHVIAEPKPKPDAGDLDGPTVPWHFKLLLVAIVIYLGFRAYQGIVWVVHHA